MSDPLSTRIVILPRTIRLPCAALFLLALGACSSGSEPMSAAINNEVLRVNLDADASYQWRVRAITATSTGPWSAKFLVTTNPVSDDYFDVSYISPDVLTADEFGNTLLFDDDLFSDDVEQSTLPGKTDFSGVPMFTWEHDANAEAYEVEIVQANILQRVGLFQFAESSLCIAGVCEIVLENTGSEALDLPPIALVGQTVVQGEAPYQLVLPSPVIDVANLPAYSHDWSIEGNYTEFPDTPEFHREFADVGSHTVNVVVTSADGRSAYARASVNVIQPAIPGSTTVSEVNQTPNVGDLELPTLESQPAVEGEIVPLVAAAKPEPEVGEEVFEPVAELEPVSSLEPVPLEGRGSSDDEEPEKELAAPVVSVTDPGPPAVEIPVLPPSEEVEEPRELENVVEKTGVQAVVDGWDNSMPNGGRAIGVVTSGITTGNSSVVKYKSSRRFLATRSGAVKAWAYQNRLLATYDLENRSKFDNAKGELYREMIAAVGMDPLRGSYMLGGSYHVGNGGSQEVSLQTDDGNGRPSGNIIAISRPYVPYDRDVNKWRYENFTTNTGMVEAGKIYHLVWENLNPPPGDLTNLSAEEAKNAPRDKGALSLDGPKAGDWLDPDEPYGPFLRDIPGVLIKKSSSSSWQQTDVLAWYSLVYADGVEVGETYRHLHGSSPYRYYVDGNKQLRQEFTWNHSNMSVDRIATRFGHKDSANGKSMDIVIKDQSKSVIAASTVSFDPELKTAAQSSSYWRERQTRHAVGYLSSAVTLETGKKYYIEYSAGSGGGFIMSPAINSSQHGTSDRNIWSDGLAKQSTDGGNSWQSLNVFPGSDLPLYLIPVGIPTKTPKP